MPAKQHKSGRASASRAGSLERSFRKTKAPSRAIKTTTLKAAAAADGKAFQELKPAKPADAPGSSNQMLPVKAHEGTDSSREINPKRCSREEADRFLRNFDFTRDYGPCCDMKRSERYQRAVKYDLKPPTIVLELIERFVQQDPTIDDNLWAKYNL